MKKFGAALIAVLMLAATLAGLAPPAEASGPLVLAFYYAWYDMNTWGSGQLPDLPVQSYTSTDAGTIARHVGEAQGAGIDGFVQSWYGPGGGNQTEGNFQILLDTAAARGFRAAVDFEVGSPYFASPQDRIAALQHLLSVHANHPAYLRVDGKPVLFFWASWLLSVDDWSAIRAQVDPGHDSLWIVEGASLDYLTVFDGLHLYNIAWSDNPAGTLGYWGGEVRARAAALGGYRYWAATVMPGWNDTLVPGRTDAFVRDRAGGSYYQLCWSGAVASGPDMVIITSFNEWAEGSTIEPSVSYGDFYLNLTAQMAASYKAGGVPAPLPPPAVEVSATPKGVEEPAVTATPAASRTPAETATPRPAPTAWPDGSIVHRVEAGDTLLGIGESYSVTLETLMMLNDLDLGSILRIGQPVVIGTASWTPTPEDATLTAVPTMTATETEPVAGRSSSDSTETEEAGEAGEAAASPEQVIIVAPRPSPRASATPPPSPSPAPTGTAAAKSPGICPGSSLLLVGVVFWMRRSRRGA